MGIHSKRPALLAMFVCALAAPASAQVVTNVTHCDSGSENCRDLLVKLIDAEAPTGGIDGAQWIYRDSTVISALIRAHKRGVPVRMLADLSSEPDHEGMTAYVNTMRDAGILVQDKTAGGGILHWKIYLFHGQGVVKYGAANSTPDDLRPIDPYKNYRNESNIFDNRASIVQSFSTKFEDAWVSPNFTNYGNVPDTLKVRKYPVYSIDTAHLAFVPGGNLKNRILALINGEKPVNGGPPGMIDLSILRLGDQQITEALIAAHAAGVEVRVNSEQAEYRVTKRFEHAYALDQLYAAGIRPRWRNHAGQNHEKTMVFHKQGVLWTGSSNLVSSSLSSNMEHNLFTSDPEEVAWYVARLSRRWFNSQFVNGVQMIESKPFAPSAPGAATSLSPANNFVGTPTQLVFNGGYYGITADVYFGTAPNPPLFMPGIVLSTNTKKAVPLPALAAGTKYYWKVVTRTHANKTSSTATLSFTTTGDAPPPSSSGDIVLWAARATTVAGAWVVEADATAAGGKRVRHPNANAPKFAVQAEPADYFELTFQAEANVPYHLWLRGKADSNSWANDSVYVQFSNVAGAAIGTTGAMSVSLEDCTNCGMSGWGWQDNANNALASPFAFSTSGPQTIRIQTREDGLAIDQIILSPSQFLNTSPGALKGDTTIYPTTADADLTAPDVALTAPADGATVAGSVTLTATATDNVAVTKVEFLVNGTVAATDSSAPFSGTWNSASIANGSAVVTARASDAAGNKKTSAPVTVTVSNAAPTGAEEIVLYAAEQAQVIGDWPVVADATAAGGARLSNPNAGALKLTTALAEPTKAFDVTFTADAGKGYRIWLRGKAVANSYNNDSVYAQFDGSVTAAGAPVWRIGTTDGTSISIEDCNGCGLQEWGWADNAYGMNALGPLVYFEQSGPQRLRIQVREDGLSIDQIVLSAVRFVKTSPGLTKNDATILAR